MRQGGKGLSGRNRDGAEDFRVLISELNPNLPG
jgi:hypothetical protein